MALGEERKLSAKQNLVLDLCVCDWSRNFINTKTLMKESTVSNEKIRVLRISKVKICLRCFEN